MTLRRPALAATALSMAVACGSTPSGPSLFSTPSSTLHGSLSGTLIRNHDGSPLAGVSVISNGLVSVTDAQGRFAFTGLPESGSAAVTANPAGYVFRSSPFALSTSRTGITLDLLQDALPFSLAYYRALVRNGYESSALSATNPWTMNPSFYVKMTVEGPNGVRIPDAVADEIRRLFTASIPELSGGRLSLGAFERGDDVRPTVVGWVNITFYEQLEVFGRSSIGGNVGAMLIRYSPSSTPATNPYNCFSPEVQVADHEIIHTMGFYHTPDALGDSLTGEGCPGAGRPEHVRYHAAVMYSRPAGNRDPDVDPAEAVRSQAPSFARPPEISCPAPFAHR